MPKSRDSAALRYLSHAANDLFWFILPLVLPLLLPRFGLSYAEAGGIITFYLALTAVGSYVMGRVSDKFPRRLLLGGGMYVAAGGLIAAGFAGSLPVFLTFLAVTALGMSTYHPAMYAHIDETYGEDKGMALGTWEASGTTAIFLMFLVNGALLEALDTGPVMAITAVPALIAGTFLLKARVLDGPAAAGRKPIRKANGNNGTAHATLGLFLLFLFTCVLRTASVAAVINFLPTIFTDFFGLRPDRAAWASGLYFIGGIGGSLAAARFSRPALSFRVLVAGSPIAAAIIACLVFPMPMAGRMALIIVFGAVSSGLLVNQNIILTALGSRFGRGEVFGILMAAMTLSASVSPTLFGWAADSGGFAFALGIFSLPVLANGVLMLAIAKPTAAVLSGRAS